MQINDNVSISFKITGYYDSTVTKKSVRQHDNSTGMIANRKQVVAAVVSRGAQTGGRLNMTDGGRPGLDRSFGLDWDSIYLCMQAVENLQGGHPHARAQIHRAWQK